jgi:hypothetical protein
MMFWRIDTLLALWVAQGQYLSENSDKGTIGRNSGLFWALLESSLVIGNLFVFLYLPSNINDISKFVIIY